MSPVNLLEIIPADLLDTQWLQFLFWVTSVREFSPIEKQNKVLREFHFIEIIKRIFRCLMVHVFWLNALKL